MRRSLRWAGLSPTAARWRPTTSSGRSRDRTTTGPVSSTRRFAAARKASWFRRVETDPDQGWILNVDDTQRALEQWARWKRRHFTGIVIGVTGSVGKTTTRQMIHTVLQSRLKGTASPRNYNNQWGVPLSMLAIEPQHDYAVLELGANRAGEIAMLAELCAPKVGVITQLGDAHLGGFGSRQGVAEAKAELLAALPSSGHAVLADDSWLRGLSSRCAAPITWIGTGPQCNLRAVNIECRQGRLEFHVACGEARGGHGPRQPKQPAAARSRCGSRFRSGAAITSTPPWPPWPWAA